MYGVLGRGCLAQNRTAVMSSMSGWEGESLKGGILQASDFNSLGVIPDDHFAGRKGKIRLDGRDVLKGKKLTGMGSLLGGVKEVHRCSPHCW